MASYREYLSYPLPYESPYLPINYYKQGGVSFAGTDDLYIYPQLDAFGKPNIWAIHRLAISLTTDATVINRYVRVYSYLPQGGGWAFSTISTAIAASQTGNITSLQCHVVTYQNYPQDNNYMGIQPDNFLVIGKQNDVTPSTQGSLRIVITNGQAGDTWLVNGVLKYQNYRLGMIPPSGNGGSPPTPPTPPPETFPPRRFLDP